MTLAIDTRRDDIVGLFDATRRDLPSFRRENSQRLLFREASFGHTHSLRLLVEAGAMPNELINDRSALFFAAGSGNAASVEVLLQLGADPNPQIKVSPLQIATAVGNYDSVHALLEAGADPNPPGEVSPLSNAVKAGDTQMVRALLEAGADPNPLRPGRTFGLAEIATVVDQADIVADLFAAGAVCRLDPEQAEFVLSHAISNDIVEMAMLALDQCVAPDHTLFGEYPITWVAEYFEAEAVRQWLTTAPLASETARPVFSPAKNLDASLERIAGSMIPLPEGMFKRFGRMETKIHLIIDEEGHARFPKVDKSLPAMLRLLVYEMIAQWRFTPPTEQGKPVKTQAVLPLVFDRPPGDTTALEMRELTTPPEAITQDDPIYPPALRRNRVGGDVLVEFIIRKDGRADFVKAIRTRVTEY